MGAAAKAVAQGITLALVFAGYYVALGKIGISGLFSHRRYFDSVVAIAGDYCGIELGTAVNRLGAAYQSSAECKLFRRGKIALV